MCTIAIATILLLMSFGTFAGTADLERAKEAARAVAGKLRTRPDERMKKALERVSKRIEDLNERVTKMDLPLMTGTIHGVKSQVPDKVYYLMISRSIPEDTLRTYAGQAERMKGHVVFVLRGFIEGPQALGPTVKFYLALARKNRYGPIEHGNIRPLDLQVDPFRFGEIERVPALSDGQDCIVYGDAPLPYLAEKLEENHCGERFGAVYEVAEEDGLMQLKKEVARLDEKALQENFKHRLSALVTDLPESDLPAAEANETHEVEPVYELPFDVPDPETGQVLYPAGYSYNPLDYIPGNLPFSLLLVNGKRKTELAWLGKNHSRFGQVTVAAIGGNVIELSRIIGRPVFSGRAIAETGWCPGTPCLVTRDGTKLKVRTWRVKDQAH